MEENGTKKEEENVKAKSKEEQKNIGKIILIIVIVLAIPPILIAIFIHQIFSNVFKLIAISEIQKQRKETIVEKEEKDYINDNIFVGKTYTLKSDEYYLSNIGPEKEEISVKDYDGKMKQVTKLNVEPGLYNIELIKGDNVEVSYTSFVASELNFILSFSKSNNKYEEIYIDTEYLKDNGNLRNGYNFYPTLEIYSLDKYGNRLTARDTEIRITKVNKKVGEEPVSSVDINKIILNEKEDGAYNKPYIVGEELSAGIYDVICLEASSDSIKQVFRIVPKEEEFKERFYRKISLDGRKPETKFVRKIKLEDGDKLFFGTAPMGFEEIDEDFVPPKIVPLKLLFIKR